MKTPLWRLGLPALAVLALGCGGDAGPRQAPEIAFTPEVLDFGVVPVDGSLTLPVEIDNLGGGEIALLSLTLTEGDPAVWKTDRNDVELIVAGDPGVVLITFSPEDQRSYTGALQLRTDAPEGGSASITLQGVGGPSVEDRDGDGYSRADGDCDDDEPGINPGAEELCDGRDTDCDGIVPGDESDDDSDGWRVCAGDCDDGNNTVYPGAPRICDDLDNDCDGQVTDHDDVDGDGFSICDGDCDDDEPRANPGRLEVCDGVDNDCDGGTDDIDNDGDGHAVCTPTGDCDDDDPTAFPVVVSPNGDDGGLGTDGDPYETLGHALANLDTECRTVVLEPGTYPDVSEAWSAAGGVTVVGRSGNPGDVTLQAAADSQHFRVSGGAGLILQDLTLSGGDAPDDGGAVQVLNGDLTLSGVIARDNASATDGGAIAVSSGTLSLQRGCVLQDNSAGDDGGAIVLGASTLDDDEGTTYANNSATNGGALRIEGGTITLRGASFEGNSAVEGGAISATGAGSLVIEGNTLWSNTASSDGGGLALRDVDSPQGLVRANRIQDNVADNGGGGIAVLGGSGEPSAVQIHNNTLAGNEATNGEGAGIWVDASLSDGVSLISNVLRTNDGASALYVLPGAGAVVSYNTGFGTNSGIHFAGEIGDGTGAPLDPTNAVRNPLLVSFSDDNDPTNDDLTLQASSPEIDDGPAGPLFTDTDGTRNDRGHTGGPAASP
ncbi:MAG TPA: hypothetical protein ENK18_09905 [Deltaproteobacteria bacterium]|nr:hypothetical protein [Deltaproteobacteria bacterium]